MDERELLRAVKSLPPEAHRELADFIAFLKLRYKAFCKGDKSKKVELSKEHFVGMWLDRADMEDSGQWVRKTREREWAQS